MKISIPILRSSRGNEALTKSEIRNPKSEMAGAFTLIEVAISLAVIGIALVAIIGVLPLGMNVQRENREGTIINQDATVFIEAISRGAQGLDDLTNYVYAITNHWTRFNDTGGFVNQGDNGYSFNNSSLAAGWVSTGFCPLNNGYRIVGLLSTPQFTDNNGFPINNLFNVGGYSNHIVAYVRSMSGAASEKPPQDNQIIKDGAFAYRILTVNAAMPGYTPQLWQPRAYNKGDQVIDNSMIYWEATATTTASDIPGGASPLWTRNFYSKQLAANLHELRLTFFWPIQPNGKVGTGRQTYRTLIAGQVVTNIVAGNHLYFYQSQSFTNAP
ncbi:MAG: hypothetical protein PHY43_04310 [Verrucomicrobiales bacterium]|nr:hypothetical protein [Verrucomicrobiales bacterium]